MPGTPSSSPYAPASGAVPLEMISPGHLRVLLSAGLPAAVAEYFFDRPTALLNLGANGGAVTASQVAAIHRAWPHARIGWLFNSFGTNTLTGHPGIQEAISSGSVPAGISYIQYDPEGPGNGTPVAETAALERGDTSYVRQAAALAHSGGWQFFFTPSVHVGMTPEEGRYPARYSTWLSQHRGRWAAVPGIDMYSIQSQQAEGTPTFATFVAAALAEAHAAASRVPVDVGIGINPSDPPTAISTADLLNAYNVAAHDGAAGYWNNVETGVGADVPPRVYVAFFEQLYAKLHG